MKKNQQLLKTMMQELQEIKSAIVRLQQESQKRKPRLRDELWTVIEVAEYLHKSKGTIQSHYQGKPGFPHSKRIGNKQYWKPQEIIAFANKRETY